MDISNLELLGDKVLIQLDSHPDHTVTETGIVIPKFINIESDGGRPKVKPSNLKYVSSGTVLAMSALAASRVALQPGDRVYVHPDTVSQSYHFLITRSKLVEDFDGVIVVPHALIEAKINSNG